MSQVIACPHCAKKLKAPTDIAGKRVTCPGCKTAFAVPAAPTVPTVAAAKSPPTPIPASGQGASPAARRLIPIVCPQCAKQLKAPAEMAGKAVRCPDCKSGFTIPGPPQPPATPTSNPTRSAIAKEVAAAAAVAPPKRPSGAMTPSRPKPAAAAVPQAKIPTRRGSSRPRFVYFAFALTMLPLVLQMLSADSDAMERFQRTMDANPELVAKIEAAGQDQELSDDELFALLPDGRFDGAHLPHQTWMHWIYAAVAAAAFFVAVRLLFEPGKSTVAQLLLIGVVTSTVGIISLLMFQFLADWSQGIWVRGRGVLVLLFYVVKFIGFSYQSALDPENGFWLSFFGFTFGVGLCEELTKAAPIFFSLGDERKLDWRGACALGLASGVGFGVAEGIMYSANYYNGVTTGDIYFTRFISCVALHATWTAAVGIMAAQRQASLNSIEGSDWLLYMLSVLAVPAVLHGLYDTLLKREMNMYALAVALASFACLAVVIERARATDDVPRSGRFAPAMA